MIIKDLKEFIKDLPDDMEVVIDGEYGRGLPPEYPLTVEKRVWDDLNYEIDEHRPAEKCLIIHIDAYLAETEDVGNTELYLTQSEYNETHRMNTQYNTEED